MHDYVDLVLIKEACGTSFFEAPAWSVRDGDIATVVLPGAYGGVRECHVKGCVTISKGSDEYKFMEAVNGGAISKVRCLYHMEEIKEEVEEEE